MPACQLCGAENQEGAQLCLACGEPLAASRRPDGLINAGVVCPTCDTYNDPGSRSCLGCGESLSGLTGYLQAVSDSLIDTLPSTPPQLDAGLPSLIDEQTRQPDTEPEAPVIGQDKARQAEAAEADRRRNQTARLHAVPTHPPPSPDTAPAATCPHCRANLPPGSGPCPACGRPVAAAAQQHTATDLSIRMRLVRGYGREDSTFPVGPAGVTVGRSGAMINIADDPFLSPVHLALRLDGGRLVAEDRSSLNGTFFRVRGEAQIRQGAELISGNQRFCLLGLGGPTTDVRLAHSADTRAYGGPVPRQLFIAIRLNHADAAHKPMAGSVILRSGPVISVGRMACDLNFPSDPAMSSCQFELHVRPSGIRLVEAGASTGVFVRIGGSIELHNGDELLVGDEVLRVEIG